LSLGASSNPTYIDEVKVNFAASLHQLNFRTVVSDAAFGNTTYGNFSLLRKDCPVGVGCSGAAPDALSSDALPASFNLAARDVASGSVQIPTNDGGGTLSFSITSIVPEAGTGLLIGVGIMVLCLPRRRVGEVTDPAP
jgi:hypothetical protein